MSTTVVSYICSDKLSLKLLTGCCAWVQWLSTGARGSQAGRPGQSGGPAAEHPCQSCKRSGNCQHQQCSSKARTCQQKVQTSSSPCRRAPQTCIACSVHMTQQVATSALPLLVVTDGWTWVSNVIASCITAGVQAAIGGHTQTSHSFEGAAGGRGWSIGQLRGQGELVVCSTECWRGGVLCRNA